MEELREMGGKPVWIENLYDGVGEWQVRLSEEWNQEKFPNWIFFHGCEEKSCDTYGKIWLAYDKEPGNIKN